MHVLGVPWLQLPGQQNILVQVLFSDRDYSVRVTDLSTIWGEDLNHNEIATRAAESGCPFDSSTNMVELLERLQNALTVDSTRISVLLQRRNEELKLTIDEASNPSTRLKWEFRLSALPYSAVASGLTLSLFAMVSFYQNQVTSLLDTISDKDNVIKQFAKHCKNAKIEFKPTRRRRAAKRFSRSGWQEHSRQLAQGQAKGSQEVIDELSLIGRESNFRNDWRAVLTKVPNWSVSFLPNTADRTPSRVTSSKKANASGLKGSNIARLFAQSPAPVSRDDTQSQNAEFESPSRRRLKKEMIHTKWSSPVHSPNHSDDSDSPDDFQPVPTTPSRLRSTQHSSTPSPTPTNRTKVTSLSHRNSSRMQPTDIDSPMKKYKVRDNRDSQTLESDLELPFDRDTPTKVVQHIQRSQEPGIAGSSEDTTDESESDDDGMNQTLDIPPTRPSNSSKRKEDQQSESRKVSMTRDRGDLVESGEQVRVSESGDGDDDRRRREMKRRQELQAIINSPAKKRPRRF